MQDGKQTRMTDGIVLRGVSKAFGNFLAVNNIDLRLERGHLTVLLGPSGCGKTTILRMIAGLENPTSGTIEINGETVFGNGRSVPTESRGIGIVFQSYALWPHMTVRDNIAFPLRVRGVGAAEKERRVRAIVELVELDRFLDRFPQQLSGGQQQRAALARALVASPSTLLLDEPLANLDARLRDSMRDEIRRVQRETETTAAHVTHDQSEALALADHIVVMNHGVIMGQGTPRQVYGAPTNLFCARFLGELNELPARIVDVRDNDRRLKVGDETVATSGRRQEAAKSGDDVVLAFRPSAVSVLLEDFTTGADQLRTGTGWPGLRRRLPGRVPAAHDRAARGERGRLSSAAGSDRGRSTRPHRCPWPRSPDIRKSRRRRHGRPGVKFSP